MGSNYCIVVIVFVEQFSICSRIRAGDYSHSFNLENLQF